MKDDTSAAFGDASRFFVAVVAQVPGAAWAGPGLGEWTVRELVAHGNRAHTTIEGYLTNPQPPQPHDSPYFAPDAIAARAREAVEALGDDPAATVTATSDRVIALVEETAADAVLGSPAGTMTLSEYLPSRVAELVIHGLDVVNAVQVDVAPPKSALDQALMFVAARATTKSPTAVLFALTGRKPLPVDYNVF